MAAEFTVQGFEIGIVTTNLEPMLEFYRDRLGFEFSGDLDFVGGTMKRFQCTQAAPAVTRAAPDKSKPASVALSSPKLLPKLMTIVPTWPHCTASIPIPTAAKPTIAPTIEWVVDTGQPLREATSNQVPAASNDASMP